jgi:hypothetical protein
MLAAKLVAKETLLTRIPPLPLRQQGSSRALLEDLHDLGRPSDLWLTDKQVNMFRHHDVTDDHASIARAHLFKN